MRFPKLQPRGAQVLQIPNFAGGMNLRDVASDIGDTKLTDCLNMWAVGGLLQTRPGLDGEKCFSVPATRTDALGNVDEIFADKINKHSIYQDDMQLCSVPCRGIDTEYIAIYFVLVGQNGYDNNSIPPLLFTNKGAIGSYFIAEKDGELYLFVNGHRIYKYNLYTSQKWEQLKETDYYVPIVAAHCKTKGSVAKTAVQTGVPLEGYNILGAYYRMIYSTVNRDLFTTSITSHKMRYPLMKNINSSKYDGKKVTAVITLPSGAEVTHEVTLSLSDGVVSGKESGFNSIDNLKMGVSKLNVTFYKSGNNGDAVATVTEDDFVEDNLEITAPFITSSDEKKKVFSMTRCEWFGGYSEGINGGTRLFLCNNRHSKNRNLVYWSGLNDPTYFPENAYFRVGNAADRVTGFAKQSDMLVLFKERETWYTTYNYNSDIKADDLISQSVVDYTASSVYFTLTQINPFIGCKYGDSIQLCRNRLVWLGADKKLYTLVSNNQYNERNIFCISEMIDRSLGETKSTDISSADWKGYYCLKVGDKLYLCDYNCYGYTHISGYSKSEDANSLIPWFYWELPLAESAVLTTVDNGLGFSFVRNSKVYNSFFSDKKDTDTVAELETDIVSSFTSKMFDFSVPNVRKNIDKISLQLGCNDGRPILAELITEAGKCSDFIYIDNGANDTREPSYIASKAFFPAIRNCVRAGLKISCNGKLAVHSAIIKYRYSGEVRI